MFVGRQTALCTGLFANHANELGGCFAGRNIARRKSTEAVGDQQQPRAVGERLDRERILLGASRARYLCPGEVHLREV